MHHLDLERVAAPPISPCRSAMSAERAADVVVAGRTGQPDGAALLLGGGAQDPRDRGRRMLRVDRLGADAGRGERGSLGMVLVAGEHHTVAQRLPGLPGERSGCDPGAGDQQDEAHSYDRSGDEPVDELGAGLDKPPLSRARRPSRTSGSNGRSAG